MVSLYKHKRMLIDWWRGEQGKRTFWILNRNQIISKLRNYIFQNKIIHIESNFQSLNATVSCVLLNTILKCHSDFSQIYQYHSCIVTTLLSWSIEGWVKDAEREPDGRRSTCPKASLSSSVNFCSVSSVIRWGGKLDSGWGGEGGRDEGYKLMA